MTTSNSFQLVGAKLLDFGIDSEYLPSGSTEYVEDPYNTPTAPWGQMATALLDSGRLLVAYGVQDTGVTSDGNVTRVRLLDQSMTVLDTVDIDDPDFVTPELTATFGARALFWGSNWVGNRSSAVLKTRIIDCSGDKISLGPERQKTGDIAVPMDAFGMGTPSLYLSAHNVVLSFGGDIVEYDAQTAEVRTWIDSHSPNETVGYHIEQDQSSFTLYSQETASTNGHWGTNVVASKFSGIGSGALAYHGSTQTPTAHGDPWPIITMDGQNVAEFLYDDSTQIIYWRGNQLNLSGYDYDYGTTCLDVGNGWMLGSSMAGLWPDVRKNDGFEQGNTDLLFGFDSDGAIDYLELDPAKIDTPYPLWWVDSSRYGNQTLSASPNTGLILVGTTHMWSNSNGASPAYGLDGGMCAAMIWLVQGVGGSESIEGEAGQHRAVFFD